jgi:hypothetical protein
MSLKPTSFDIVIIGHFNPFILHPNWLTETGILSSREFTLNMKFDQAGRGGGLGFEQAGTNWSVSFSRLQISGPDASKVDPNWLVAVLNKLPHTPVSAVGHNIHFRAPRAELQDRLPSLGSAMSGDFDFGGNSELESTKWSALYRRQDTAGSGLHKLMVEVEQTQADVRLHVNFHRDVGNAEQAAFALQKIEFDRSQCKDMLSAALGVEIE